MTSHRPENVGVKRPLKNILDALGKIHKKYEKVIIFSMHPRTFDRKMDSTNKRYSS